MSYQRITLKQVENFIIANPNTAMKVLTDLKASKEGKLLMVYERLSRAQDFFRMQQLCKTPGCTEQTYKRIFIDFQKQYNEVFDMITDELNVIQVGIDHLSRH